MKRLFIKLFIFALSILAIEYGISMLIRTSIFNTNIINTSIFNIQDKSKGKHNAKTLVIGDSVGEQLYGDDDSDDVCSLASNQGVTIAGYYFLVKNYLKINTPQNVYLLVCPNTLQNTLSKVSYNYFLKPFYTKEYRPMMNKHLISAIKEIPYYWMCQFPIVFSTSYTPEYDMDKTAPISTVSYTYIDSIYTLCKNKGIDFHLRICPIRKSVQQETEKLKDMFRNDIYIDAFSRVTYLPDSCFIDGTHLKKEFIPKDYLRIYE